MDHNIGELLRTMAGRVHGRRRRALVVLCMIGITTAQLFAQRGSQGNIEKLMSQAGIIFAGRVIDVETGIRDRMNLYMTAYTFQVLDPVFGVDTDTLTIKQYGGEANGHKFYPSGIPRFEIGEEVVVFLYPLSYIGMTSAVGKEQGKFWIRSGDSVGTKVVVNKAENKGLFRKLSHPELVADQQWLDRGAGPLPYKQFMKTLHNFAQELKGRNHRQHQTSSNRDLPH